MVILVIWLSLDRPHKPLLPPPVCDPPYFALQVHSPSRCTGNPPLPDRSGPCRWLRPATRLQWPRSPLRWPASACHPRRPERGSNLGQSRPRPVTSAGTVPWQNPSLMPTSSMDSQMGIQKGSVIIPPPYTQSHRACLFHTDPDLDQRSNCWFTPSNRRYLVWEPTYGSLIEIQIRTKQTGPMVVNLLT